MLDMKLIRADKQGIERRLRTKEPDISLDRLLLLDEEYRSLKTQVENLKNRRNQTSKTIGEQKRRGEDCSCALAEMSEMADEIALLDKRLAESDKELQGILATLPNLPMEDVKVSQGKDNVLLKEYKSKPQFDFPFKNHLELNESLHLFDFKRAAKTTGSGWPAYRGMGARLEWALLHYMWDIHIKNGFIPWLPPLLVRPEIMYGSGQLPKFETQLFKISDPDYHLYLLPTSEVILNGLYADEILSEDELPMKFIAYTPCFRREAGAAGAQERGLIRVHQFNKVEMFCFAKPEESQPLFDEMVAAAEEILQGLDLHYRNMLLTTGDMSWQAARTIDIEVWLPGQNRYYEVSSISNCTDFQARRSQIRFRKEGKPELVHTLNGSGLATSRLMVALLENNQHADGSVSLPKALQPYLGGIDKLLPIEDGR